MKVSTSRHRRHVLPGALALAALVVLLIAGSRPRAVRTFALDAPNQFTLAVLRPSDVVCEGPVTTPSPARSVGIWGAAASAKSRIRVDVRDAAGGALVTSGEVTAVPVETEWIARLASTIPAGRSLRICLTQTDGAFSVSGSPAVDPNVVLKGRITGPQPGPVAGKEFSLVLLSDANRSLWSSLSTAFSRASLWRPSWVGSWTFWLLAAAFLGTFGLAIAAVGQAAASDEDEPRPGGGDHDVPPSPRERSGETSRSAVSGRAGLEPGQDRSQPVPERDRRLPPQL